MSQVAAVIIKENLETRSPIIDLGNCGLTAIPKEIVGLRHLEEVRLGINYWDENKEEWIDSINNGERNSIDSSTFYLLEHLPMLKKLSAGHNAITNIDFINTLNKIEYVQLIKNNIDKIPYVNNKTIKNIDLSNNSIIDITQIAGLSNIVSIDLSNNKIEDITTLDLLKKVKTVNLSNNRISNINVLSSLQKLETLNLNDNLIRDLLPLYDKKTINELNISYNPIDDLSICASLSNLKYLKCSQVDAVNFNFIHALFKLEELDISDNFIAESFLNIYNKNLKKIEIQRVKNETLSLYVSETTELEHVNLSFTNILSIDTISKCPNIKYLDLHYCKDILDWSSISNFSQLEDLLIYGCNIEDISFITSLKNLKRLNINSNPIANLDCIESCIELEDLDISFNKVSNIDFISKLTNLKILKLNYNNIKNYYPLIQLKKIEDIYIDDDINFDVNILNSFENLNSLSLVNCGIHDSNFLRKHKKLKRLNLNDNKITDISFLEDLDKIKSISFDGNTNISDYNYLGKKIELYSVSLSRCKLSNVNFLSNLHNVITLDLSHNNLKDLSPISEFKNLISLDLSYNSILDLSKIEDLSNLRSLDLRKNKIKTISLKFFQNIKSEWILSDESRYTYNKVNLAGNPLEFPPIEVIKQGNELVEEYYKSSTLKSLNECKIILVGRGKVGKTSLQKRITGEKFDSNEPETHGIRKVKWHRSIKSFDKSYIKVNIWDFGGQYIQQTLHQFFYTPNTVYILLLDRRLDEDPEDFLELIKVYGESAPVILVYNNTINLKSKTNVKYDLHPEIDSRLRNKYYNIQPKAFGVCCGLDNDEGVQLLRENLVNLIPNLDHVTRKYPTDWISIKDNLLNLVKGNYIEYSKYSDLCYQNGIDASNLQQDLAKMLNDVGTITFFNEQFLGNYYILNPEWITTGVYKIILSNVTNTKKGKISVDDVENILFDAGEFKYNKNDCNFLLKLMNSFSLSHEFNTKEWLIPTALGGQSYADLTKFKEQTFRLYYIEYKSSFPNSVIHRFIARNVEYAYNEDYWRSGIVVKHPYSDTCIYVEADRKDRQIRLWIKGDRIRDCWEFFRKDFIEFSKKFEFNEYVSLDSNSTYKVSYQDLLSCIESNHLSWFVPGYGDIDVMETLGLFSDIKNIELIKKMFQEKTGNQTVTNIQGNINITDSQVGGINNGGDSQNTFYKFTSSETKSVKNIDKEAKQNEYRDKRVASWRLEGWAWTLGFFIVTLIGLFYVMYLVDWSLDLSSPAWKKIASNGLYVFVCTLIVMLLNGVFIKSLYDKYKSHSNIKAFREMLKIPEDLK